jgi:GT2 family glycosyltransferase
MTARGRRHVLVVEAYDGIREPVFPTEGDRRASRGLGLPLSEMAELLHARITVLQWRAWHLLEERGAVFPGWMAYPATRFINAPDDPAPAVRWRSSRVKNRDIRPLDAADGRPVEGREPSLRALGLFADNDPLAYLAYRLARELEWLGREDPFDLVILPQWGGLGAQAQLERASGCGSVPDVPFGVVVTDSSARRQDANMEGMWTREAVVRRQHEDLSLGLADLVLTFGPRGIALARQGRLTDAPPAVQIPRRVSADTVNALRGKDRPNTKHHGAFAFTFRGVLAPAAGALVTLDAALSLDRSGITPTPGGISCTGPDCWFAPMPARSFRDFWSSRAAVQELERRGWWQWESTPAPGASLAVQVDPAPWAHLPNGIAAVADGALPLLSAPSTEGLVEYADLPAEARLGSEPDADRVASAIARLIEGGVAQAERVRTAVVAAVAEYHEKQRRAEAIGAAVEALDALLERAPDPQPIDRVLRCLLDRGRTLRELDEAPHRSEPPDTLPTSAASLAVVIPCHNVGNLVREAVESVWQSERVPEQLIVVDDGSTDADTLAALTDLEREASQQKRPFTLLRQRNEGLPAARNAGLAAVESDLIAFLDADDVLEAPFLRLAWTLMSRHQGLGGVAGWSEIISEDGSLTGHWNAPQAELPLQLAENGIFVPVVMRTGLLRSLGGVDAAQRFNYEDWELSCRLLCAGWPVLTIPAYLQRYRVRADSLSRTISPAQHQVMRERLLSRHRSTVERFAVELSMLLEHRWARRALAGPELSASPAGARQEPREVPE